MIGHLRRRGFQLPAVTILFGGLNQPNRLNQLWAWPSGLEPRIGTRRNESFYLEHQSRSRVTAVYLGL